MLACAQDLYFHNEKSLTRKDSFPSIAHQDLHKVTKKTHMMSHHHHHHHHSNHHHQEKDKEEQVWPPEVESAFIEALETIPKLGRRKILVNGKPCGRNELISDYIYRKTSKIRTRKQVSSHIQVLKNTRKSDPHFMRLLTDSVEVDEEFINRHKTTTKNNNNHSTPVKRQHNTTKQNKQSSSFNNNNNNALPPQSTPTPLTQLPSNLSITSDESSIHSSPSPADYVFDMMYSSSSSTQPYPLLDMKDSFYQPIPPPHLSQALFNHHPSNSNNNNNNILSSPPPPSSSSTTSTSFMLTAPSTPMEFSSSFSNHHHHQQQQQQIPYPPSQEFYSQDMMFQHDITNTTPIMTMKKNKSMNQKTMPLLPNYIGLYLEYPSPYEPSMIISHTLAQTNPLMDSYSSFLPSNDTIVKQKYHSLLSIHPTLSSLSTDQILLAKMKLDLNLNMNDYVFNNTSFFESMERKTIECTTTIYSFGSVVLESKELQQALLMDQKYMYSFVYVNQFFDAFMKGILSLPSWHEMDMAIQNLSIVQVFEEINDQVSSSSSMGRVPLLAMVYDFERGHGTIDLNTL
ncbi:TEA/ATTS domain family-domain-containing protein [Cunninghamella echinulata]|nr:TEA/ATTS domain family-domain-containing protein [Cunninghamella echinulata]